MKILMVDDHPLIVEGVSLALREIDAGVRVFEANESTAAQALLREHPDISLVLLDLALPGDVGLSPIKQLRAIRTEVPLVVFSARDDRETVLAALAHGARGFISKCSSSQVLLSAIRLVLAGGIYIPPQVLSAARPAPMRPSPRLGLTERQTEVLALLMKGKPNKLICRELNVSEGTVKTHVSAILRALNVSNRAQVVYAVNQMGVTLPGSKPGML